MHQLQRTVKKRPEKLLLGFGNFYPVDFLIFVLSRTGAKGIQSGIRSIHTSTNFTRLSFFPQVYPDTG